MKRFFDTAEWLDPWYRKLSPQAKHLKKFLWDNCDCAGVVGVDLESVSFLVGQSIKENHLAELKGWLENLPSGKYLIPSFIHFQCGDLSTSCPAHKPVLHAIQSHGLVRVGIVYTHDANTLSDRLSHSLQEKEKEKEKEKDTTGGCGGRKHPTLDECKLAASKVGMSDSEVERFFNHYESNGWKVGKNPMRSMPHAMAGWMMRQACSQQSLPYINSKPVEDWRDSL